MVNQPVGARYHEPDHRRRPADDVQTLANGNLLVSAGVQGINLCLMEACGPAPSPRMIPLAPQLG